MKPIQLLLLGFILFALTKVVQKYRQREIQILEFLLWILLWIGTASIITFPDSTSVLAALLGIGRGADLIIYSSLLVVLYLIFRIHLTLDHVEHEITEIVRTIALDRLKEQSQPSSAETSGGKEHRV